MKAKLQYVLRGAVQEGDVIRLLMQNVNNLVKNRKTLQDLVGGGSLNAAMNQMADQQRKATVPDTVCVPLADWERDPRRIGDTVTITVDVS